MSGSKIDKKRAAVVGAGAVGACCAAYLQRDGHDVVVLDPDGFGRGCSEGTVGIFATNIIAPASSAGGVKAMLTAAQNPDLDTLMINKEFLSEFLPWMASFVATSGPLSFALGREALKEAQRLSIPALRAILDKDVFDEHVKERGWISAYESEASFKAGKADRDVRKQHGIAVEELDEKQLKSIEPSLPEKLKFATLFPREYHTANVNKFIAAIGDVALRNGAVLKQRSVDHIEPQDDGTFHVHAGGEIVHVDVVVIAAGAYSAKLAAELGSPVLHCAERGYGVTFENADVGLNTPVTLAQNKCVIAPMEAGLHVISSGEFAPIDTQPDERHQDRLISIAQDLYPELVGKTVTRWSGWRSTVPDGLPVIDESPVHKGVFYAFGHSHLGLTQAGLSGAIISALAGGREPVMNNTPFKIDRFSLTPTY
ncbi:FAD-binding oxidoreductase [Falsochrobactrum sp. TDYN1]|uniref:FAD-binding oxidoreductase n=1 Tax=Falsochrobactrum tianjinense TaxID=2706015 RepID=A0A949UT96_9HYPH|nr:FAD-binding oxidoreductase [Falsochrobactrum sp. TDYN1]MBV2143789.1 FAD-binding oxidoreductase [Falsochrobactrum sp. TDYN1]